MASSGGRMGGDHCPGNRTQPGARGHFSLRWRAVPGPQGGGPGWAQMAQESPPPVPSCRTRAHCGGRPPPLWPPSTRGRASAETPRWTPVNWGLRVSPHLVPHADHSLGDPTQAWTPAHPKATRCHRSLRGHAGRGDQVQRSPRAQPGLCDWTQLPSALRHCQLRSRLRLTTRGHE